MLWIDSWHMSKSWIYSVEEDKIEWGMSEITEFVREKKKYNGRITYDG